MYKNRCYQAPHLAKHPVQGQLISLLDSTANKEVETVSNRGVFASLKCSGWGYIFLETQCLRKK